MDHFDLKEFKKVQWWCQLAALLRMWTARQYYDDDDSITKTDDKISLIMI